MNRVTSERAIPWLQVLFSRFFIGGKPNQRYCCGDGIRQKAEGNGSICDGNV